MISLTRAAYQELLLWKEDDYQKIFNKGGEMIETKKAPNKKLKINRSGVNLFMLLVKHKQ